jgi:predicted amidophosphoribosyltransferase
LLLLLLIGEKVVFLYSNKNMDMEINPRKIDGHWQEGWALDLHTLSSIRIEDASGNARFDTKRPPIAEELYELKYRKDKRKVDNIAETVANFLIEKNEQWQVDVIVPVPPSDTERTFQPVFELANSIGEKISLPVDSTTLKKEDSTPPLKTIDDPEERREILKSAFNVDLGSFAEKNVLIFDDIYRSGETLNAVADAITIQGNAKNIYALTVTKTRAKR